MQINQIMHAFEQAGFNYFSAGTIPSQYNPKQIAADYFLSDPISDETWNELKRLIPDVQFARATKEYAPEIVRLAVIIPR